MNIVKIKESIKRCIDKKLVPFIQGSPGLGKSAIVREIADDMNLDIIDLRLSQCDITDLNGLPKLSGEKSTFLPFDTYPLQKDSLPEGKNGWILFLDELNSAVRSVQCASYKLILDRMVGQHKLHDNVYIVAAGNLVTDNAVVNQMPTALRSRLINLILTVDSDSWLEWALKNNIDTRIYCFIKYKPKNLFVFNPAKTDHTFACPRTWEMLSKLIEGENDLKSMEELIYSTIGEVYEEFISFDEECRNLPTVDDIINNSAKVPEKVGYKWMTTFHILQNIMKVPDDKLDIIFNYLKSMGDEYLVIFTSQLTGNAKQKIMQNSNFLTYLKDCL